MFRPVFLSLLAAASMAFADEITLVDGRVLEGEVISDPDADVVDLRTTSGGMSVTQHFPKHQIAKITYGSTPRQQAVAAVAKARADLGEGGTAEQWFALVQQAKAIGDPILTRDLAGEVVARDRRHAEAHRLLGHVSYRGVWMRANEASLAQGLVVHDGRAITWREREELLARAEEERLLAQERRQQREADRRDRLLRAAAARAVTDGPGDSYYSNGYFSSSDYYYPYRSVYWQPGCAPVYATPVYGGGSSISIGGSGGSGSFNWGFSWNSSSSW